MIKETLRVLPVAPSGGTRYIFEDFEVPYVDAQDGKQKVARFRKGDFVQPFIYGAQHDPFYWSGPHPDVWEPQRWLDDPTAGGAKNLFANNPFGNGSRRCIGEKLALGETRLLLASILRKYDVKPGEYKFVAKNEATVSAKFGVKVKLTPVE